MLRDETGHYRTEHDIDLIALDTHPLPATDIYSARKLAAELGLFLCSI